MIEELFFFVSSTLWLVKTYLNSGNLPKLYYRLLLLLLFDPVMMSGSNRFEFEPAKIWIPLPHVSSYSFGPLSKFKSTLTPKFGINRKRPDKSSSRTNGEYFEPFIKSIARTVFILQIFRHHSNTLRIIILALYKNQKVP